MNNSVQLATPFTLGLISRGRSECKQQSYRYGSEILSIFVVMFTEN